MPDDQRQELQPQQWTGRRRQRVEDARLLTGRGCFVGDVALPGCLQLAVLRSPHPAAAIRSIDTQAARALPGVVAVFTGADMAALGQAAINPLVPGLKPLPFALLAQGAVQAVGQPVAAVLADTAATAQDGADLVQVDYASGDAAAFPDATRLAQAWRGGEPDAAFAAAEQVVEIDLAYERVAAMPMEPRNAAASVDAETGRLTVYLSTQTPHRARADLAQILCLDAERIRVIAPDIGGAFGGKASIFPEDALVAFAALTLRRPVRWQGSRAEDLLAGTHARGARLRGALAVARDGIVQGLRARLDFPLGHWMPYSAAVPARNAARILPGPYHVDAVDISIAAHAGNHAAVGIYRGAGRPEAAMLLERLMDRAARALGLDPLAFRRRNLRADHLQPVQTATGETLDSGRYRAVLDRAAALADYDGLRARQAARRASGEIVGIGIGLFIEPCGQGWESADIRILPDGRIDVACGATAQGQGRATAFQQIVADVLGLPPEAIAIRQGDTDASPPGIGALASRGTAIGGSAVKRAAEELLEKARALAAQMLLRPAHEIVHDEAGFRAGEPPVLGLARSRVVAGAPRLPRPGRGVEHRLLHRRRCDRRRYRRAAHRAAFLRRRHRHGREPDAGRGPGPGRRGAGHRRGADGARGL
jgi:carbon-monoxide dehydrogenase large subunit